jgi:hypothetical protein
MASLTRLTTGGGCAAKYSAARLQELLAGFVPVEAENLLVGLAPADDAAVYKLDEERALVFTLDFFPPLVDDPAAFGRIAAIVHVHSPYATAWAQACLPIPCLGTTHADHFRGPVPVTRPLTPEEIAGGYEEATGAAIVELGLDPCSVPAALVASHAPFAWGADIEVAVENAVALEAVAASTYRALVLRSDCAAIDNGLLAKHFDRKHGPGAYYGQPT